MAKFESRGNLEVSFDTQHRNPTLVAADGSGWMDTVHAPLVLIGVCV
jgi:hypothetical protein